MSKEHAVRNSNIELLRIIAMFFIVAGHFISQSGNVVYSFCINDYVLVFLGSGARIAVNVFLIVSAWYLVDSKFSVDRIVKLYIQVITYSLPITFIMLFLNRENASIKDFARGFLPFLGRGLWFASAYITLLLFKPFLDKILNWSRKELGWFVGLLFVFISAVSTLPDAQAGYVIDSVWFLVVYLFIGYIKKYDLSLVIPNWISAILAGGGYIILTVCIFLGKCFPDGNILIRVVSRLAGQYSGDIKTLPNFVIAFLLVMWFLRRKERHSKVINGLSKSVFSVYIVHQVPAFISFIWKRIFMADIWIPGHSFWYVFVVFAILIVVCCTMDYFRRKIIEPRAVQTKVYKKVIPILESAYNLNEV